MNNLNKMEWFPISSQIDKDKLLILLSKKRIKKLVCFHNWIYWKFNNATKQHRVCNKCYKKQQSSIIIFKYNSKWIQDRYYE